MVQRLGGETNMSIAPRLLEGWKVCPVCTKQFKSSYDVCDNCKKCDKNVTVPKLLWGPQDDEIKKIEERIKLYSDVSNPKNTRHQKINGFTQVKLLPINAEHIRALRERIRIVKALKEQTEVDK
jgi:hypothetical protein